MARRDLSGAVDFGVLERMTASDAEVGEEVLGLFVEQSRMWAALLDPDGEGWRDAAHTLRGAAAGIGAADLAEAGAAAEAAEPPTHHSALERVRLELDRALADVAAYRHELMLRGLKG
ncbi:Hpt domain-containing protein [Brevundimonas sp.]|uniref:Hpt domain-containing protein n=1 Tax=Brevundimonas sp. TaxID=1871086 RepID=UPI0035B04B2E